MNAEHNLENYITQLEARISELERDKARLDWIEKHRVELRCLPISKYWYLQRPGKPWEESQAPTIREAIDAAIARDVKGAA